MGKHNKPVIEKRTAMDYIINILTSGHGGSYHFTKRGFPILGYIGHCGRFRVILYTVWLWIFKLIYKN